MTVFRVVVRVAMSKTGLVVVQKWNCTVVTDAWPIRFSCNPQLLPVQTCCTSKHKHIKIMFSWMRFSLCATSWLVTGCVCPSGLRRGLVEAIKPLRLQAAIHKPCILLHYTGFPLWRLLLLCKQTASSGLLWNTKYRTLRQTSLSVLSRVGLDVLLGTLTTHTPAPIIC